jgi:hypothetical protein
VELAGEDADVAARHDLIQSDRRWRRRSST